MAGTPDADVLRHSRLAQLEEGLLGLLHFYGEFQRWGNAGEPMQAGWYYSTLVNHADMCFTADRGGDQQPGAALRCLRDLGRLDLKEALEKPLGAPINKDGRKLGDAIHRMRNQAQIHHSFDFEERGATLIYVGEPDPEMSGAAWEGLTEAVKGVLAEVQKEKEALISKMYLNGTLAEYYEWIGQAPQEARERERERRRAQGQQAKQATTREQSTS